MEQDNLLDAQPRGACVGFGKSERSQKLKTQKPSFWHQPQLFMNLSSVVFFCVGCFMMVLSHQQSTTQVIMKYPSEHGNVALSMVIKDGMKSKRSEQPRVPQASRGEDAGGNGAARVELESYGNVVSLNEALTLSSPRPIAMPRQKLTHEEDLSEDEAASVKVFIGIISSCCNELSQRRRMQIRETWMRYTLDRHKNVKIKFILGQPDNSSVMAAMALLQDEVEANDDIVFVRGYDTYNNLPQKTIGLMRYVSSIPDQYTHLLKTDDDCYVRMNKVLDSFRTTDGLYLLDNLYLGCMENKSGFQPVRDPQSKWHMSMETLTDEMANKIWGTKYLAGWGYVLSRDVVLHALGKVDEWDLHQDKAPFWYKVIKWEDVMMGLLLQDKIRSPIEAVGFKAAWRACTNQTAIRHLDLDAPQLFYGLHEQEMSGLWARKTVQCSSGQFMAGDYHGWKTWRNSVAAPNQRV